MFSRVAAATCLRVRTSQVHKRLLCPMVNNQRNNLLKCDVGRVSKQHYTRVPKAEKLTVWNKIFGKYLLTTNTISSGILMVIGDWVAQAIDIRRRRKLGEQVQIDYKRIWRMFVVGALMGPMHHYVYMWMDQIMPVVTVRNTIKKILIDQFVMSPACILIFFYSACFLESRTINETNQEVVSKFFYIYVMDWVLWPGAQFINFQYLDIKYRVSFVNICTAAYNVFLSYMKHDFGEKV